MPCRAATESNTTATVAREHSTQFVECAAGCAAPGRRQYRCRSDDVNAHDWYQCQRVLRVHWCSRVSGAGHTGRRVVFVGQSRVMLSTNNAAVAHTHTHSNNTGSVSRPTKHKGVTCSRHQLPVPSTQYVKCCTACWYQGHGCKHLLVQLSIANTESS